VLYRVVKLGGVVRWSWRQSEAREKVGLPGVVVPSLDGNSMNENAAGSLPALPTMAIQDMKKIGTRSPLRKSLIGWNVKEWDSEFSVVLLFNCNRKDATKTTASHSI